MRISDAEVGVVAVHNLAGLLEDEVGCERWEVKWEMTGVDVGDQHPEARLKIPLSVACLLRFVRLRPRRWHDGTEVWKQKVRFVEQHPSPFGCIHSYI